MLDIEVLYLILNNKNALNHDIFMSWFIFLFVDSWRELNIVNALAQPC